MMHAALLGLAIVQAQVPDLRLPVPAEVGRRVTYEYRKEKLEIVDGEAKPRPTGYTHVEMELVSKGEDRLVLAWTMGATHMDDPEVDRAWRSAPGAEAVREATEGMRIEIELDPAGPPRRIVNEDEVKPRLRAILLASDEAERLNGRAKGGERESQEAIDRMLSSPDFAQLYLKDTQLFFLGRGLDLPREGVLEGEGEVPNMFGGPPIPAKARFEVLLETAETATLRFELAPEAEELRGILYETLKPMTKGSRNPVRSLEDVPEMDIRDAATVVVNLNDGWTESVAWQRTVTLSGNCNIEKRSFRRVSEGK